MGLDWIELNWIELNISLYSAWLVVHPLVIRWGQAILASWRRKANVQGRLPMDALLKIVCGFSVSGNCISVMPVNIVFIISLFHLFLILLTFFSNFIIIFSNFIIKKIKFWFILI